MYLESIRRHRGKRSERFVACARLFVVKPGFRKGADRSVCNHLRFARIPQAQLSRLFRFWIGALHVDYQHIEALVEVDSRGHASPALFELAVVKVKPALVVRSLRQFFESWQHNLSGRQTQRKCVAAVQLRSESLLCPNRNTEPSIAQGHRFARQRIRSL